jgi:hypothetical protein
MAHGVKSRAPSPLPAPAPSLIIPARPACGSLRADRRPFDDYRGQAGVYSRAERIGYGTISATPAPLGTFLEGPGRGGSRHGGHSRPTGDGHQTLSPRSPCLHHRPRTTGDPFHKRWSQRLAPMAIGRPRHEPSRYVQPVGSVVANRVSSAPSAEPPSSGTVPDVDEKSPWTQSSATTVPALRRRGPCRPAAVRGAGSRTVGRPRPVSGVALVCW